RQIIQDEETVEKIESHGLKVIEGYASFEDKNTLSINPLSNSPLKGERASSKGGENEPHLSSQERVERGVVGEKIQITAGNIVLATGSSAQKIKIDGVDDSDILTNHEIFEQTGDIKKLVIIGGGYIGSELAESIASLGVEVHLIQRNKYLIPREEEASSKLLREIFESKGISVHTEMVAKEATEKILTITDKQGENEQKISYDKILIALGRSANIEKLNVEAGGIESDKRGIIVDKYNRTSEKHIFAIGDCVSGNPQFTHWANNEGRGVIRNILVPGFMKKSVRNMTLPAVLYTHLEVARVGKTRSELLKSYGENDIVTKQLDFETNDRSKVTKDTQGFVKIHFKRLTGKILGATIYGAGAGEMLGMITSAMDNKVSAYKLAATIQAYPTKSDLIKRVSDQFVVGTVSNITRELKYFFKDNILQILTGLIWLVLLVLFFWYKSSSGQSFEEMAITFYNSLSGNTMGVIIFIIAYALRPIILFPATLMTLLAGALFGFGIGTFATVTGATLSALTAYIIGTIFGKKIISGEDSGIIGKLRKDVNTAPFTSILSTRLLFFPFDIVNYASGFLKVKILPFLLATFVGIIPGSAVFVLAGSSAYNEEISSFSDITSQADTGILFLAAGLFLVIIGFTKLFKKLKK
ncbi:FAD-dependent oxidoreductase, partial [Candidatus Gracilibacteria bacterium]|nr:FAD-dependent oxidoreductase [Candidatus Gracilibacteria bacterium]